MTLPMKARTVMNRIDTQVINPSMLLTLVLSPLIAKKRGSKSPETKSSSFSIKATPSDPFGMTNPNTKAPKTECVPMASVINPEIITPVRIKQILNSLILSPSGVFRISHAIIGLIMKIQNKTKPVRDATICRRRGRKEQGFQYLGMLAKIGTMARL